MKRIITLFMAMLMLCSNVVYAENRQTEKIYPKENGYFITTETDIHGNDTQTAWLPLRSALEAIGAEVEWNEKNRSIGIFCNGERYIAELDYIKYIEAPTINICKYKYREYSPVNLSVNLSSWGGGSEYRMRNNRTYLDDFSMIRLFYYLGYYIDINSDNTFTIIPVNEESDKVYKEWYADEFQILEGIDTEIDGLMWLWNYIEEQNNIYNVNNCSSERLENDDLEIVLKFTYIDKEREKELTDPNKWQPIDDAGLCSRFGGKEAYRCVEYEDTCYYSYIIKCDEYYVGYCLVPSKYLK